MNQILRFLVLYGGTVIGLAKILQLIYLFQVKEYRFDRFIVSLQENGGISYLYQIDPRFPAKSIRNLLVAIISLCLLAFILFYMQSASFLLLLLFLLTSPVISFLLVSVGVLLTEILARIKRALIIRDAEEFLQNKKVVGIGITGSYGKSTTKEDLSHILSQKFKVAKTDENMNTDVGIAMSVLKNVTAETEFFIAEVGAYTEGEIRRACKVIQPFYAILTAIGNQHLDLFGSKEKLILAKKELLEEVPPNGRIYLNADIDDKSVLVRSIKTKIVLYSAKKQADISVSKKGSQYALRYKRNVVSFPVPSHVPYALETLLPCIGLALDLGMNPEQIEKSLGSLPVLKEKLSRSKGIRKAVIIRDTANSSVEGFLAALEPLANTKQSKRIAVSKGIIELGEEKESSYKRILDQLHKKKIALYTTDPVFKTLDIEETVAYFKNEQLLAIDLIKNIDSKTAVLLEGRFSPSFIAKLEPEGSLK